MSSEKETLVDFTHCFLSFTALIDLIPLGKKELMQASLAEIRQVAYDMVELAKGLDESRIEELNTRLINSGLPSVDDLQSGILDRAKKITSRAKDDNEQQFRVVRSRIEIRDSTREDADLLQTLMDVYNFKNS